MKQYRLLADGGTISDKLFNLKDAMSEVDNSNGAIIAVVTPRSHIIIYEVYQLQGRY